MALERELNKLEALCYKVPGVYKLKFSLNSLLDLSGDKHQFQWATKAHFLVLTVKT